MPGIPHNRRPGTPQHRVTNKQLVRKVIKRGAEALLKPRKPNHPGGIYSTRPAIPAHVTIPPDAPGGEPSVVSINLQSQSQMKWLRALEKAAGAPFPIVRVDGLPVPPGVWANMDDIPTGRGRPPQLR